MWRVALFWFILVIPGHLDSSEGEILSLILPLTEMMLLHLSASAEKFSLFPMLREAPTKKGRAAKFFFRLK